MTSKLVPPCTCSSPSSVIQEQIELFYESLPEGEVAHGVAVGVIDNSSAGVPPAITRCYSGYANVQHGIPISEKTIFEIGSVSKTFTTTILAAAVHAGCVDLDEAAQAYYDKYELDVTLPYYTDGPSGERVPMTMLDLADYTSGIPDKSPTNTGKPNEYPFSLMHEYLENDFPNGLPVKPGTEFNYVNTNFGIIAELMMLMGGFKTYEDALRDLFHKAGLDMPSMGVITSNSPCIPNLAQGYQTDGSVENDYALPTWPALQGAGGIYSNLNDMLQWLQFNMGLTDSRYNELLPMLHQVRFPAASQTGEGLGWFTGFLNGKGKGPLLITKNGGTSGFHSWIGFLQDRTIGAVVLCNTSMPGSLPINKNGSPVDLLGEAILKALSSPG